MMTVYCPGSGYVPNGSLIYSSTILSSTSMKDKSAPDIFLTLGYAKSGSFSPT